MRLTDDSGGIFYLLTEQELVELCSVPTSDGNSESSQVMRETIGGVEYQVIYFPDDGDQRRQILNDAAKTW